MALSLHHTTPEAFDPSTGRVDALRLASLLALNAKDMATITGKTCCFIRMDPDASSLQPNLRRLLNIVDTLKRNLVDNLGDVRIWLNAPTPTSRGSASSTSATQEFKQP